VGESCGEENGKGDTGSIKRPRTQRNGGHHDGHGHDGEKKTADTENRKASWLRRGGRRRTQ
jgi:hypothetical protein